MCICSYWCYSPTSVTSLCFKLLLLLLEHLWQLCVLVCWPLPWLLQFHSLQVAYLELWVSRMSCHHCHWNQQTPQGVLPASPLYHSNNLHLRWFHNTAFLLSLRPMPIMQWVFHRWGLFQIWASHWNSYAGAIAFASNLLHQWGLIIWVFTSAGLCIIHMVSISASWSWFMTHTGMHWVAVSPTVLS